MTPPDDRDPDAPQASDAGDAAPGPDAAPASVSAEEMFADEPAPPPTTGSADDELRDAVGVAQPRRRAPAPTPTRAARRDDDAADPDRDPDDDDGPPRKRGRAGLVLAVALLAGGFIASLVLLGRSNAGRYELRCGKDRIVAERGRSFPPWGTERLEGAQWAPIAIPPEAECEHRETDDVSELAGWYLDALVEQAQAKLTAKEVTDVDQAQRELEQALLLARDPERRDQRKEIERLLGDVEYWRGAARVRGAIDALEDAARRYDTAADRRPRHASDAAAWAEYLREIARDLRAGPAGANRAPDPAADVAGPPAPRPEVPAGVALPVEEPRAPEEPPAAPPVDAGVPRGGVLL